MGFGEVDFVGFLVENESYLFMVKYVVFVDLY